MGDSKGAKKAGQAGQPARSAGKLGNRNVKSGTAWEEAITSSLALVDGLVLDHFGPPVRILGVGVTKAGRRAPMVAFTGPAPLDFCGHYRGRHIELDAKRCESGLTWRWASALSSDQMARCSRLTAGGCMMGILLLIDDAQWAYGISWKYLARLAAQHRMSVTSDKLGEATPREGVWSLKPNGTRWDVRPFIAGLAGEDGQ